MAGDISLNGDQCIMGQMATAVEIGRLTARQSQRIQTVMHALDLRGQFMRGLSFNLGGDAADGGQFNQQLQLQLGIV
ncbi:MAG: hypothetical protein MO846_12385 [Candidatus Devosia symbiotica]|nr:hypothetical protein [Candidatus Devosia symbiotica]